MMVTIERILVPVDFSDCSREALRHARELAARFGASIHVLHVWEVPAYVPPEAMVGVPGQTLIATTENHARHELDEFVSSEREGGTPIAEVSLKAGSPARTIVETAAAERYDLIVIGTHGRKGLSRVLLGSVAEKVVRLAACPVLSVRHVERRS